MARRGVEVLSRVPLFSGLSRRQLKRIGVPAQEVHYMEGASVVREGEEADSFFVIVEGQAKVVRRDGRVLNRLLPGDFFGEISLLDGGRRTASVVSETPLTVLKLERRPFAKMLREDPGIAVKMLEELAGRLRRMERSLSG
ncbi:MAG: cyclic nucleotide-binding domain-containing protein [Actinobacteria bacterium]|nr:cyclic nucleotide-binding domain-containing protein [Actinomycetota bacterium]